ncbi:zonular occludens toxin domain-containing protein [Aliarcobacter butzleri]|uniref:zonular occludens toxin domain-containing protein n=1 Tax=Aliarcobacter butzleri TaxID=28197 RepID=UPI00344E312E
MSAYAYIGLQGSGKTLKAVNKLYDNFINPKTKNKSEYDCALTNINEFDFSKSNRINKLDFDVLYSHLMQLFDMSVNQKCTDTELNEKAKEFNLFGCLIIIDEAPHYFTKDKDDILLWWIEYHRHMYQDIILITPNKARFRTEYRNSIHYFVKSVSAKYRIRKNVYKYAVFSNYNMNKDDFEHFESFTVKKELFSLYQSGKAINATPIIYYYIAAIITILILFIFFSLSFLNQFSSNKEVKNKNVEKTIEDDKSQNPNIIKNNIENKKENKPFIDNSNSLLIDESEKMFKVKCSSNLCYIQLDNNIYEFPFSFFEIILKNIDSSKLEIQKTQTFNTFYFLTNENYFNFIIKKNHKGESNEKNKNDSNLFSVGN